MFFILLIYKFEFPDTGSISSKTDVLDFLTSITDSSGYFSKEPSFTKEFPEVYNDYLKWDQPVETSNWKFKQKIYHFLNNDTDLNLGRCEVCGKRCNFINIKHGYNRFCSLRCTGKSEDRMRKIKETNLKLYGFTSPMKNETVKNKTIITMYERYGGFGMGSKTIRDKIKSTNLEKFGTEYTFSSQTIKDKTKETFIKNYGTDNPFGNKNIQDKIKSTNLDKYGTEVAIMSERVKQKQMLTNLEKYGSICPLNNSEIQQKSKETLMKNYGVGNPFESEEIKEKSKQTCQEKYGVDFYVQTNEFARSHRKPIEYDGIMFDSSWEVEVYKFCIRNGMNVIYQPDIKLTYEYEGKIHYYQPDFLIDGKIYEVKGDHFFDGDRLVNPYNRNMDGLIETKFRCMIENGVVILRGEDVERMKKE